MNARARSTLSLAFKAVALGMATIVCILVIVNPATIATYITLLSIGLFCLATATVADRPKD